MAGRVKRWLLLPCLLAAVSLLSSCAPTECRPQPCPPSPPLCFEAPAPAVAELPPPATTPAAPASARIKIFVTNDVHGYVVEDDKKGRIGYALLKGHIEEAERQGYATYLLDSGDAFSGSAYANFDSGRSVAALMGKMGYRVLEPGNHAFDYNLPEKDPLYYANTLIKTVAENDANPLSVVCLNLSRNGGPFPGVGREPVVLHDGTGPGGDGLRLVVVGVITPYAASATNKAGLAGCDFGLRRTAGEVSHADTRRALMATLSEAVKPYDRPGDIVVVLSHVGHDDTDDYAHGQATGRDLASIPNVDFVSDAHSHTRVPPERIGDAVYGSGGRYLEGFNEITVTAEGGEVEAVMELRKRADLGDVSPSPDMLAAVGRITEKLGMNDRLFEVPDGELLSDDGISLGSTGLGRFLCRAMARIAGADLALYNSGGIRSGLSAGWATVGGIYNATPFMNDLQTFSMTGGQILAMFNSLPAVNTNGFPQFYGMTAYAWTEGEGPSPRLRVAGLLDGNGKPLGVDKTYAVALNSFMAGGGDGFTFRKQGDLDNFGDLTTVIVRELRKGGDQRLDELRPNSTLIIFANEALAREAWRQAGGAEEQEIRKAG